MYTLQEVEQIENFLNSLLTDESSSRPLENQPPPYPPQDPQMYHGTLRSNQNVPPEPRPIPPNRSRQHPYMNRTMRHNILPAQNRSWSAPFPHEHQPHYRPNMPWSSNPYSLMTQTGSNYINTPGFWPNRWPARPHNIPAIPPFTPQAYGPYQGQRAVPPINWTNQGSFPELVEPSIWCSPPQCSPETLQQQVWARQLWQAEQEIRQNPNPGVGWRQPPPSSFIPDGAFGSDVPPGPQYGIYTDRNARNPPSVHGYQEQARHSMDLQARQSMDLQTRQSMELQARQSMDLQARQGFELWLQHVMAVYGSNVRANSQTMRDQYLDEANCSPEFRRGAIEMAQYLISKVSAPNEPWDDQGP